MNCKPGDLAVYIGEQTDLVGYITRVVRRDDWRGLAAWRIDPPFPKVDEFPDDWVADCVMRPIRDQPGADETLTWAGLPARIANPEPTHA